MAIKINDYPLTLTIDNREFSCRLGDWQLVIDYPLGGLLFEFRSVPFRFPGTRSHSFSEESYWLPCTGNGSAPYSSGRPSGERVEFGALT
jgi:hypothetical protein